MRLLQVVAYTLCAAYTPTAVWNVTKLVVQHMCVTLRREEDS